MTKLIPVFVFSLFLSSCQNVSEDCSTSQSQESSSSTACSETSDIPNDPKTGLDVPNEALFFDSEVSFFNFEREDEDKVYKALEIIKKVVASKEFRDSVYNHTYGNAHSFVDNDGLSNEDIYLKILDGAEGLKPDVDYKMNLELQLYYSSRSTVGYTYPTGLRIWMNTKFFDQYTPSEVAGNIFHEWTHKLGFDHASSYSVSRDYSVPYALGYLMSDLGKQYE